GVTVSSGGLIDLYELDLGSGQVAAISGYYVSVAGVGGGMTVKSGGRVEADFIEVLSGAALSVGTGPSFGGATLSARGELVGGGLIASGAVTDYGLVSGVVFSGAVVPGGMSSTLTVGSGGVADDVTLQSLGVLTVEAGGHASATKVGARGWDDVFGVAV